MDSTWQSGFYDVPLFLRWKIAHGIISTGYIITLWSVAIESKVYTTTLTRFLILTPLATKVNKCVDEMSHHSSDNKHNQWYIVLEGR